MSKVDARLSDPFTLDLSLRRGARMAENASSGLLTVAEVAAAMRVSKATVYRLLHAREIPAARFGRSYRVAESAVADYIARAGFGQSTDYEVQAP